LLYGARELRSFPRTPPLAGVSLRLRSPERSLPVLPEECACCAAPSTHSVALRLAARDSLLVHYCDECADHQAAHSARGLALSLASLLLALSGAAGLPLLAPRLGMFGLCAGALLLALLPLCALLLPPRPLQAPHAARGLAVIWGGGDRLLCAAPRFGEAVASLNESAAEPTLIRERVASPWLWAGPVIAVGAACLSFFVYHPLLRILNLGTLSVQVALDGEPLVVIDPTSNESPVAGALLRVPAGAHRLSVRSSVDGAELGSVQVELQSGAVHLYAFGAEQTCFWLESTGYGREQRVGPSYQPLRSSEYFWALPGGIDTWFAPNPETSDPGARSSGGILTALRQAPCSEAPPEVRAGQ